MSNAPHNKKIVSALSWKFLERVGVLGAQFVLQIFLARLLDPSHYGAVSLMIVFTTLANVFIQRGFNTALIQNKDVTDEDYSSVFWVTLGIAAVAYAILFFCAPLIARLYKLPEIVTPFRVLALLLFPGALNSIQRAKVSRALDFRKVFYGNLAGILLAGFSGIAIAKMGGGLWALVAQNLVNVTVSCFVMRFLVNWKIRFVCNLQRVKILFSYGWKLLVAGLIDTLYQDLRSLVIGAKYDAGTLGYYDRGKHFPQYIINVINSTVQTVMLPAMSSKQDDLNEVKTMMRTSITMSAYLIFPMMAGLAGVATPLVTLLLTEKWLPCVPYMQIYCFTLAFHPVHSCNLQAINAVGRSDIFIKLEVIKKAIGIASLAVAVFCFNDPIAIALTGVFTTLTSCFINAYPSQKLFGYSYLQQMRDILPYFVLSMVMLALVLAVQLLHLSSLCTILVQVLLGVVFYGGLSAALRLKPFTQLLQTVKGLGKSKKRKDTDHE